MIVCNTRNLGSTLTGVQRYTSEILNRISDHVDSVQPGKPLSGVKGHIWEQLVLPFQLHGRLLWSPSNTGPIGIERQVVSIMDVSPLDHPEWSSSNFSQWYQFIIPRLVNRVRGVITISEFSRQRILNYCPQAESKIHVTPLAADSRFKQQEAHLSALVSEKLGLPSPYYVVALGSLEPRKNLKMLLKAWNSIQAKLPDEIWLVLAGAKGKKLVFGDQSFAHLPPRVHLTGHVHDDDLPALYSRAIASVYLSLYEGFGLPPLESMACGTPVLTSNTTSLPEVTGEAAMTVNPTDFDAVAEALVMLLSDTDLRNELRHKGLERAKLFSWEKTALQTIQILKQVDEI